MMKGRGVFFLLNLFLVTMHGFAANVNVPALELYTHGSTEGGDFGFVSRGELDLLVEGGYKFAGRVELNYFSPSLEEAATSGSLTFKSASILLKEIFSLPLDFSYFIGENATFCSGDLFPETFGSLPFTTRYRGFLTFPQGVIYDGLHTLYGTGMKLDYSRQKELWLLSLFLYQDAKVDIPFEPGRYSLDFRGALNFSRLKLEAFLGATYPAPGSTLGYLRAGLLFFAAEEGVEFLAQIGIPRWSPLEDSFSIDLFYLLFEPRVRLGLFSIIPTFFWRPSYYHQQVTEEQAFDVNLNLQIGRPPLTRVNGGLEGNFSYQIESAGSAQSDFQIKVSPYLQVETSGVIWETKVNAKLWPFALDELIEVFLAVKAEF